MMHRLLSGLALPLLLTATPLNAHAVCSGGEDPAFEELSCFDTGCGVVPSLFADPRRWTGAAAGGLFHLDVSWPSGARFGFYSQHSSCNREATLETDGATGERYLALRGRYKDKQGSSNAPATVRLYDSGVLKLLTRGRIFTIYALCGIRYKKAVARTEGSLSVEIDGHVTFNEGSRVTGALSFLAY